MTATAWESPASEAGGPRPQDDASRRWRFALPFAGVWLLLLVQPALDAVDRASSTVQAVVGVALVVGVAVAYLAAVVVGWDSRDRRRRRALLLLLIVLAPLVLPFSGESGLTSFVFVAVVVQISFSWRVALVSAAALVVLVAAIVEVADWGDPWSWVFSIITASLAMFGVARTVERNRALLEAQFDREQYAVLAERERFARDLHDILGHSLTVISVKSELAGRLVDLDVEGARAEIADIQRLARQALGDVRATVGNYRQVSLAGEVASARAALLAAGIEPDLPTAVDDVPAELAELFAYVVREGVTNVVRHSGAAHCAVRLDARSVEVVDDGRGSGPGEVRHGHGLDGLRARLAERGCALRTESLAGGGFRLAATTAGAAP